MLITLDLTFLEVCHVKRALEDVNYLPESKAAEACRKAASQINEAQKKDIEFAELLGYASVDAMYEKFDMRVEGEEE